MIDRLPMQAAAADWTRKRWVLLAMDYRRPVLTPSPLVYHHLQNSYSRQPVVTN
jgi:hypothetical protein